MGSTCMTPKNYATPRNKGLFRQIEGLQIQAEDTDIKVSALDILQMKKQVSQCLEKGHLKMHDSQLLKLKKQISSGKIPLQDLIGLSKQISGSTQCSDTREQEKSLQPGDFMLIDQLGSGAFGTVSLVRYKANQQLYALKAISKSDVLLYNMTQCALLEKDILLDNARRGSLFLLHLFAAFQTPSRLYLVTEYLQGGDLFSLLQKKLQLKESYVRFYLAEVLLALEELHSRHIIYRDLKPENVLLRGDGHIKLADFGLSRQSGPRDRHYTLCGTIEYQAPEMILKQGYGLSVDYWALGVLAYEMLFGKPPFYDSHRDNAVITQQILNNGVVFHKSRTLSESCKAFIKECTHSNVKKRLGHQGIAQIKSHPFFRGIDWSRLASHRYDPPLLATTRPRNLYRRQTYKETPGKTQPKLIGFSFMEGQRVSF